MIERDKPRRAGYTCVLCQICRQRNAWNDFFNYESINGGLTMQHDVFLWFQEPSISDTRTWSNMVQKPKDAFQGWAYRGGGQRSFAAPPLAFGTFCWGFHIKRIFFLVVFPPPFRVSLYALGRKEGRTDEKVE